MTEKERIITGLIVNETYQEFLDQTTKMIRQFEKNGYEVETNYQTSVDPTYGSVGHSMYIIGRLKDKPNYGKVVEWVEDTYGTGHMPTAIYNRLMEVLGLEENQIVVD